MIILLEPEIKHVIAYSKRKMSKDRSGHGFDHIERVVNLTKRILADKPTANAMIALTAAYLHDIFDDKVVSDPQAAKNQLRRNLLNWHYSATQVKAIFAIIDHMSFSDNLQLHYHLSIEGQIVQDADRLDAIGAIGIIRAAYYSGHLGEVIYDPKIKPRAYQNKAEYRHHRGTLINHFHEKLFKLKDYMNTAPARRIAEHRNRFMARFIDEFFSEWQGGH